MADEDCSSAFRECSNQFNSNRQSSSAPIENGIGIYSLQRSDYNSDPDTSTATGSTTDSASEIATDSATETATETSSDTATETATEEEGDDDKNYHGNLTRTSDDNHDHRSCDNGGGNDGQYRQLSQPQVFDMPNSETVATTLPNMLQHKTPSAAVSAVDVVNPVASSAPSIQNTSFTNFLSGDDSNATATTATAITATTATDTNSSRINLTLIKDENIDLSSPITKSNSSSPILQTSTGARPKVPQLYSSSTLSRMRRSPRFSSFNSQASLTEYAGGAIPNVATATDQGNLEYCMHVGLSSVFMKNGPKNGGGEGVTSLKDQMPRSFSNYETLNSLNMLTSPRKRFVDADLPEFLERTIRTHSRSPPFFDASGSKQHLLSAGTRDNDAVYSTNHCISLNTAISSNSILIQKNQSKSTRMPGPVSTLTSLNTASTTTSALPDFVQDHWLDTWKSPATVDKAFTFSKDVAVGLTEQLKTVGEVGAFNELLQQSPSFNPPAMNTIDYSKVASSNRSTKAKDKLRPSRIMPDFLSDGSVAHSSKTNHERLSSNTFNLTQYISSTVAENIQLNAKIDKLQHSLSETQILLRWQTKRSDELEMQLKKKIYRNTLMSSAVKYNIDSCLEAQFMNSNAMLSTQLQNALALSPFTELKEKNRLLKGEVDTLKQKVTGIIEGGAVGGKIPSDDESSIQSLTLCGNAYTLGSQKLLSDLHKAIEFA